MTQTGQLAAEVAALLEYEPDLLFAELEIRRREIEDDPALAADFAPAGARRSVVVAPLDDLRDAGRALFARASPGAHRLVCGGGKNAARLEMPRSAGGRAAFAAALADALAASGGPPPALAAVVAALAARLFVSDAGEVMCAAWAAEPFASPG
jgi:hypothetical protein